MITETVTWSILEAFAKFGFEDGDGANFTEDVADALRTQGFEVETDSWGMHNYLIFKVEGHGHTIEFDGYSIPRWSELPAEFQQAMKDLDEGMNADLWYQEGNDCGLDWTTPNDEADSAA